MSGTLFVVGTPIGNLGDFSPRARQTLEDCDFIAAEDTRVTAKLLHYFDIHKPMQSYHEHNLRESGEKIVARLLNGESCALVTDAGMPAISDPGEQLVNACHEAGLRVESVPGPVAFATALAISGLATGRFCFEGFLSMNTSTRRAHLASLQKETRTMVFYEAPHKLLATLRSLESTLGNRQIVIARELTKLYEEVVRGSLQEVILRYAEKPPRGEIVLLVAGAAPEEAQPLATLQEAVELAKELLKQGLPPSAAAKQAAKESGQSRRDIYDKIK